MTYAVALGKLDIIRYFIESIKVNAKLCFADLSNTSHSTTEDLSSVERCFCIFIAMSEQRFLLEYLL